MPPFAIGLSDLSLSLVNIKKTSSRVDTLTDDLQSNTAALSKVGVARHTP